MLYELIFGQEHADLAFLHYMYMRGPRGVAVNTFEAGPDSRRLTTSRKFLEALKKRNGNFMGWYGVLPSFSHLHTCC
jgi:hypothetical protein